MMNFDENDYDDGGHGHECYERMRQQAITTPPAEQPTFMEYGSKPHTDTLLLSDSHGGFGAESSPDTRADNFQAKDYAGQPPATDATSRKVTSSEASRISRNTLERAEAARREYEQPVTVENSADYLQASKGFCTCETPYLGVQELGSVPACERCGKNIKADATPAPERPPIDTERPNIEEHLTLPHDPHVYPTRAWDQKLCQYALALESKLRDAENALKFQRVLSGNANISLEKQVLVNEQLLQQLADAQAALREEQEQYRTRDGALNLSVSHETYLHRLLSDAQAERENVEKQLAAARALRQAEDRLRKLEAGGDY